MTFQILIQIFFLGIGLSMDAFSVALVDGLTIKGITKGKMFFIAILFGFMQALMPLIGFWLVEVIEVVAGVEAGAKAGHIATLVVVWLAFALLLYVGGKMLFESIKGLVNPPEEKIEKEFSYKDIFLYSVLTAIDALAAGVALHTGLSNNYTVFLHVSIILIITFILSLIGLLLAKQIIKFLKGKYEIAGIIGGSILILLAIWVVLSHYLGI